MSDKASPDPLSHFQKNLTASLLNADRDVPDILGAGQNHPKKRFDIYRNNIYVGLIDAISDGFPVVRRLVGDEFFQALAFEFVKSHLPTSPVMMKYGSEFPKFLADFEPVKSLPYLADVASLEWLYNESFHEADAETISLDHVFEAAHDRLGEIVLTCHPALRVICSDYSVLSLWQANRADILDEQVELTDVDKSENVLLTRPNLDVELRWLMPGGAEFISALQKGEKLGIAIGTTMGKLPDFDLQSLLTILFESGAVSAFSFRQ